MASGNTIIQLNTRFLRICNFYFTVIEPIAALGGVYMCFWQPLRFVTGTISPTHVVLSDVEKALIAQMGGLYGLFTVMGALILRNSRDCGVWRNVAIGCALSDIGHLYGATIVQGLDHALSCWLWTAEDWLNFGSLYAGLALRLAFLLVTPTQSETHRKST